jgi:two-component system NarL family sensor kinase
MAEDRDNRGRRGAQALAAEDRERRRISQTLHDDALQLLLAADQDLRELDNEDGGEALARARSALERAIRSLRDIALELHPIVLERKGLETALDAVAQGAADLGGFRGKVAVTVEPDAIGVSDQLVLSVARELLMNAAKHAEASAVSVSVGCAEDSITVAVADDGTGIEPGRPEAALAEGHLGLAMLTERMDAVGGSFELAEPEGGGTVATATFPADATEPR